MKNISFNLFRSCLFVLAVFISLSFIASSFLIIKRFDWFNLTIGITGLIIIVIYIVAQKINFNDKNKNR